MVLSLAIVIAGCEVSTPILKGMENPEFGATLEVFDPDLTVDDERDASISNHDMITDQTLITDQALIIDQGAGFEEWGLEEYGLGDLWVSDDGMTDAYDVTSELDMGTPDQSIESPTYDAGLAYDMTLIQIDRGITQDSDPSSFLPMNNCIATKNETCIISLDENEREVCDEWVDIYQDMGAPTWNGTETSCTFGRTTNLVDDSSNLLNFHRKFSNVSRIDLPFIRVREDEDLSECAHAQSLQSIYGSAPITNSAHECYDPEFEDSISDDNYELLLGGWTPLVFFMKTLDGLSSDVVSEGILKRHQLLSSNLTEIKVGHRARAGCYEYNQSVSRAATSFYPGIGPIPIEVVAEENHNQHRIPWSAKIDTNLSGIRVQVNQVSNNLRLLVEGEMIYYNPQLVGFLPNQRPQPNQLYQFMVTGLDQTQVQIQYFFYFWFTDCGLRFPTSCQPNEACPLTSSYCDNLALRGWRGECRWRGGVPLNHRCDDTAGGACQEGVCFNDEFSIVNQKYCRALCQNDIMSLQDDCFEVCPNGLLEEVSGDIFACIPID